MIDKGKKPINAEEDDKQYKQTSSSHCTMSNHRMSFDGSSESSGSSPKMNFLIRDENEDVEEDEVLWNHVDQSSKNLTENHNNDMESMINFVSNMGEQSSISCRSITKPVGPVRKAMPPDVLAKLSVQDPKKAKRIIANRMSAVRAKEKKKLHTFMLHHQIHTLQTHSASSNANLALIQAQNLSFASENAMLKDEMSRVLQQIRFQDALNDGIRREIEELKMLVETNGNHQQQQQAAGMMLNNIGNASGQDNTINNAAIAQFQYPANNQTQQVPNHPYNRVEQVQTGIEQMSVGQQLYDHPWQVHQSANQFVIPQDPNSNPEFPDPNLTDVNPFLYHHQQQQKDDERNQ